jgi:phage shock protein A
MDTIEKLEKKITELEGKKEQLEKQRDMIMNTEGKLKRKERTRQLIQMGALAEKYFGIHEVAVFEEYLKTITEARIKTENKA